VRRRWRRLRRMQQRLGANGFALLVAHESGGFSLFRRHQ
jgi:hypothetical protein